VVETAERILTEAMLGHQRRCAADLSLGLNEEAFAEAERAFGREYRRLWDPRGDEASHEEALFSALRAFLWAYLVFAGDS